MKGLKRHISLMLLLLLAASEAFACKITPSFTYSSTHTCGLPTIVSASNTSSGNGNPVAKYWWKVNGVKHLDTIIGRSSTVIFLKTTGTNSVRLFVKDSAGCIDSSNSNITVTSNAKTILDQNQVYSYTPSWMNCLQFITDPDSFRVNFESADTLNDLRIFWGDGALDTARNNLLPNTIKTHLYTSMGIFNIKIVTTNGSCTDTVYGMVYNQRQPTAGIVGPTSGSNRGCVPHTLRIVNNSYNISNNTNFLIDWGNGDTENKPWTAYNDTFFHTYRKGVCAGIIKITATNVCGSSFSTWNPIDISDKDKALWAVTTTCNPTGNFVFQNLSTDRYCLLPDIKEYFWDFGDSSTVGWTGSKASQSHKYKKEGDYTVMLIAKTACGNDTFRNVVRVFYNPQAGFIYNADRSCKPLIVKLTDTSKGRGYTRLWTVREGSTVKTFTDSILNYTFTTPGVHSIQLTVTNVCGSSSVSKTFVVTDKPKAGFAAIASTCVPVNAAFTNSSFSYFSNATYQWDFGDSSSSTLKNPAAKVYTQPGTYHLRLIVSDSCGTDTFRQSFTAYGLPEARFSADSSACTFDSVVFRNTSLNSNSYSWDFGDLQTAVSSDTGIIRHVYSVSANYTVRLISGTGSGCKDTLTRNIFIKPGARALFDLNQSFACSPATFRFTNKSIYGKDYRWYANGVLVSTTATLSDTLLNTDSTVISLKLIATSASSCQDDSIVKPFFTPKNPKAEIGNRDSGCGTLRVQFVNASTHYSSSFWTLGNGDSSALNAPLAFYRSAALRDTFYYPTLKVRNWAGCSDSVSSVVKVFPGPTAVLGLSADKGCGPLEITFSNSSRSNNNDPFSSLRHRWNFGDGSYSDSAAPLHIFAASDSRDTFYNVSLKVLTLNGCSDSVNAAVQVYPLPDVRFSPDKTSGCALLQVNFVNHSDPNDTGNISMMQFAWRSGNGFSGSDSNFSAAYGASQYGDTTYTVHLTGISEHGCADSSVQTITVHPQPLAVFTLNRNDGCTPLQVNTINRSVSKDGGPLTHVWTFGNSYASALADDSTLYLNNSNSDLSFAVNYTAVSQYGCRDTATDLVTVRPKPVAGFNVPNAVFCAPALVQVRDSSINAFTHYWGEGQSGFTGNATESMLLRGLSLFDTLYILAHQVASVHGCLSDTVYKQVLVNGRPQAGFDLSHDSACARQNLQFANHSLGAFRYRWTFGDNTQSTAVNPAHRYALTGNGTDSSFRTMLEATSVKGCKDSAYKDVYLVNAPLEKIALSQSTGCTDLTLQISHPAGRFRTLYWDAGDNSPRISTDTFTHTFVNSAGNVTFQPRISLYRQRFNCLDTAYAFAMVYPKPVAAFTVQRNDPCDAGIYQIVNRSKFNSSNAWFIDSVAAYNGISFSALLPGLPDKDTAYLIQLQVQNSYLCSDTTEVVVKAKRKLKIDFSSNPFVACENAPVRFVNQSLNAVRYFWSFGDGDISNDVNPDHEYKRYGNYKIMLYGYDKDGCIDSSDGTAFQRVLERPVADFTYLPAFPKLPNALVNFTATPTILTVNQNDLSYEWDFGDNSFPTANAADMNPSHTYTIPGTVAVRLKVSNQACSHQVTKYIFIEDPKPVVDFLPDTLEGCVPLKVKFTNNTVNVTSYRWIFGDGSPDATVREPEHVFTLPGSWDVTLIATGSGGTTTMTRKFLITTYPKPILDFYTGTRFLSLPNAVFNIRNNSNTVRDNWTLSDSDGMVVQTSQLKDPTFIINNTGRFNLQLIGSNAYGCTDTLIKPDYLSTQGPGYVYVPNAFSPNKNGQNDGFMPSLYNVKDRNYSFRIFNRWGEMVFETTDINAVWDGTFNGRPCAQEVFIWTVNGEFYNSDLFAFRGTVTLLR